MGNAGLLLVGSAIFVNGLALLGIVTVKSTWPLNFLVGLIQTLLPTLVIIQAQGDLAIINTAWPVYLFGLGHTWWGIVGWTDSDPTAFGWYCLFIVLICIYQAITLFLTNPILSAMWVTWGALWGMFFVLLSLRLTSLGGLDLGRFSGWLLVFLGIPSCTVTALIIFNQAWSNTATAGAVSFGVIALSVILSVALAKRRRTSESGIIADVPTTAVSE